ncbi:MAG: hypothetical protein RL641_413 [Candidatus Parcubacteria bacterium]|jgi:uncharacterized protein YggU (UPF0235/DUF167 family)
MYVRVSVLPGSKKEKVLQEKGDSFIVHVKEKAEQNMANNRMKELIALHFCIRVADIRIIHGHHDRTKLLSLMGLEKKSDLAV